MVFWARSNFRGTLSGEGTGVVNSLAFPFTERKELLCIFAMAISTPLTQLLNIQHPILLAGMDRTSGAPLVAAVSNAGGLGVLGGVNYTPQMLREMIKETKVYFHLFYNIEFNPLVGF